MKFVKTHYENLLIVLATMSLVSHFSSIQYYIYKIKKFLPKNVIQISTVLAVSFVRYGFQNIKTDPLNIASTTDPCYSLL